LSILVACKNCGALITISPCRAWRTNYCSNKCRQEVKEKIKESRKRNCIQCGNVFFPRKKQIDDGNGKLCSAACRNKYLIPAFTSEAAKKKAKETYMKNLEAGLIVHPIGKNNPRWKGGQSECVRRRIEDGRARDSVKQYRSKNPDKVREWSHTRLKRKTGRLPRNTVKNLMVSQNGKCVLCEKDISASYHVDHIMPLSKGGKHVADNIQLLCPTCNVRKSNKVL
jgi:hypothetical protein